MTRTTSSGTKPPGQKPIVWLAGEVKTPPFSAEARQEAGMLLRLLQQGETLGMPHAEKLSIIGPRCGALRIRDEDHSWRIIFRIDSDAIVIAEVHSKKTRKLPDEVVDRCRKRLNSYDGIG